MLSPPGLFSITTGWPHFCVSFSANSRPPMSAPAPGPNGTMNFTVRVGQVCACAGATSGVASRAMAARTNLIGDIGISLGYLAFVGTLSIFSVKHNVLRPHPEEGALAPVSKDVLHVLPMV